MRLLLITVFLALHASALVCKKPSAAGCGQCCRRWPDRCMVFQGTGNVYNGWSAEEACPQGCPMCAQCFDSELEMITDSLNSMKTACGAEQSPCAARLEADNTTFSDGTDKCYSPQSCACACYRVSQLKSQCAYLIPTTLSRWIE